jgi:proteasome lid subunit RPN8/RPN11
MNMTVMEKLELPRPLVNAILSQAQQAPDNEVCGLIGGRDGQAEHLYPIDNTALDQARRFQMDPREQIDAMRRMRDNGEDLIAIYHSHPHAPALPSDTDLAEAAYPEAMYLIVSLNTVGVLEMAAFRIHDRQAKEVALQLA